MKATVSGVDISHMAQPLQQPAGALDLVVALLPLLGIEPSLDVGIDCGLGRQTIRLPSSDCRTRQRTPES